MMLSTHEARAIVLREAKPGATEVVPLERLHHRVIARPLIAAWDLPRFDCSAADGYAVMVADVADARLERPSELKLKGRVAAGNVSADALTRGTAIQIFTGAPVPAGTEAVVMQEFAAVRNGTVWIQRAVVHGASIRYRGGEFREGVEVLPTGTCLNAAGVGLMAALGVAEFEVYVRPKIALISTGSEIVDSGELLSEGQIYNANATTLTCELENLGIRPVLVRHATDDPQRVRAALAEALDTADVIITSGGVSVGDTDYVKPALRDLGVTLHFESVNMKPGKPTCFGTRGSQLIFGLPGNPVAVLVTNHHFVKPALRRVRGESSPEPITLTARLTAPLHKTHDRAEWVRAKLHNLNHDLQVMPTSGQDSHMLGGMAKADCLIYFPSHETSLGAGSIVDAELL